MHIIRREHAPMSAYRPNTLDDHFGRLVENMIGDFFGPYSAAGRTGEPAALMPRMDVRETEQGFIIECEMPGCQKEDVKVSIEDRNVMLEGEGRRRSAQREGEHVVYAERTRRTFARSFALPSEVDGDNANATLENGMLLLNLPKKQPSQPKKLAVQ